MNAPRTEGTSLSSDFKLQIQIGEVCCAVCCRDASLFARFQESYGGFLSNKPADFTIEVDAFHRMSPSEVTDALQRARIAQNGNRFKATDLFEGTFNPADCLLQVKVERSLFDPSVDFKLMNRIFVSAYYTAYQLKHRGPPPALLVHACGIIRDGRALIFTGPSGAGKTTVARLCGSDHGIVANDEAVLVSRSASNDNTLRLHGVPIIGGCSRGQDEGAPLRSVLVLKQSKKTEFHRLSRLDAYLRFIRQVISPAYFGQSDKEPFWSLITDFTDEVTRTIPFFELEFALDREHLWEVVGKLEEILRKEEEVVAKRTG